ncbi:MAG: DUF2384 domain-containing protein [Chromatiales bacterium]|jgi:hypothetical protein
MTLDIPPDKRVEFTRAAFRVLGAWKVPAAAYPALLGLPGDIKPRVLNRYRLGTALPDEPDVYRRIALLMEIDNALHSLFPHSPASGDLWITTPRVKFDGLTPLDIMLERGTAGMRRLIDVLNNQEGM